MAQGTFSRSELRKALLLNMLPKELSMEERFQLAGRVGFEALEVPPPGSPEELKAMKEASERSGVKIHSLICGGWQHPLSSADPEVAKAGIEFFRVSLRSAKELGADGILVVTARVDAETRYKDAYERSQERLRELIPTAKELGIKMCVEFVWNNFLLSPLEFARYIDEMGSPWVQAYFDTGNVVAYGWTEDWIRTLGKRTYKIHLKDFRRGDRSWQNLGDGDVNWPEVRKALDEVGYHGYVTPELGAGDEKYLRDISKRVDKIIAGG